MSHAVDESQAKSKGWPLTAKTTQGGEVPNGTLCLVWRCHNGFADDCL